MAREFDLAIFEPYFTAVGSILYDPDSTAFRAKKTSRRSPASSSLVMTGGTLTRSACKSGWEPVFQCHVISSPITVFSRINLNSTISPLFNVVLSTDFVNTIFGIFSGTTGISIVYFSGLSHSSGYSMVILAVV